MSAYTEVEGIPVGIQGTYWLLLENQSKASPALPLPPAAPEEDQVADEEASIAELLLENDALQTAIDDLQDRVVLQSKQIRDLETYRRQVSTANAMEASARAEARALRERNQKLVEEGDKAVAQLRAKVLEEQQGRAAAESDARMCQDALDHAMASRQADLPQQVACAKRLASVLQRGLDEIDADIKQALGAHDETWNFAYAKLRVGLPEAVKTELVRMQQEQEPAVPTTPAATARGHMAPPPAPLKRARTVPSRLSEDDAEELREAWKREGLEGPVGDDHDADMAAMSARTVRFADEVLVDARGPAVAMQ